MLIPYSWLKDFINLRKPAEQVAEDLSLAVIGVNGIQTFGREKILDLDVTYNRGDLLSVAGVARELSAMYGLKFKERETLFSVPDSADRLKVKSSAKLARTYTLTRISNLSYKSTPKEIQARLEAAGMRSVNLWADLTNYVMLEWGQPLHAFDAEKVARRDKSVNVEVRNARRGETIKTLDGLDRNLTAKDIVIADRKGPIAVAGVIGGEETEVDEGTTEILLEAAIFDPLSIRRTARRLGLRSEASNRFEHYLSPENLHTALHKAVQLYQRHGKGKATGSGLVGESQTKTEPVVLTQDKLDAAAGEKIPVLEVKEALKLLNFKVMSSDRGLLCWPPHYRGDITITADLIEEVLRMYGYENIPSRPIETVISGAPENSFEFWRDAAVNLLAGIGFREIKTYPFVSTSSLTHVLNAKELLKIKNPISAETEYLRDRLLLSICESAQLNSPRTSKGMVFELEKVYPKEGEFLSLGALVWGSKSPYLEIKGALEALLRRAGIEADFSPVKDGMLHPSQSAQITVGKQIIGSVGTLHPHLAESYGIEGAGVFELNFEALAGLARRWPEFKPFSNYPEIIEDFSFTLEEKNHLGKLISQIEGVSELVENTVIIDRYSEKGKRSFAVRVTFQSNEKGLSVGEIEPIRKKIQSLIRRSGGILRE